MTASYEDQVPNADLPETDARTDFATDPVEQEAPLTARTASPAARPAQDGPKAPEPDKAAPTASQASADPAATVVLPEAIAPAATPVFVATPELHESHPARLPPAARPVKQGG